MMKILLAYPARARTVDGIRDYATLAVEQLRMDGDDAVLLRPPTGVMLGPSLTSDLPRNGAATLVVQYNPFSWGRWGVAPSLPFACALVRVRRRHVRILLAIHEAYVPVRGLRSLLMGTWQRVQVRILLALAHGAFAMTTHLARELSSAWPNRPLRQVPVSSNLPDERASRQAARIAEGYENRLVIATLSTGHEAHLYGHVLRAVEAVARAAAQPVVLLLLGSNNVPPRDIPAVERTIAPGYLDAQSLARALSTADLFLAPFVDGATTRRTSLMAALQHGVATITTLSDRTEAVLADSDALTFAAPQDTEGFVAQAVRMAMDAKVRAEHGLAGRALYDRHFSWPAVCAGLRGVVAAAGETSS